jgi:hypothetical protein
VFSEPVLTEELFSVNMSTQENCKIEEQRIEPFIESMIGIYSNDTSIHMRKNVDQWGLLASTSKAGTS